jgi:hypothetical protein
MNSHSENLDVMCRNTQNFLPWVANIPILFLTSQRAKAYQTVGVNFLTMSASSELEPGPRAGRLVAVVAAQVAEGVREASHESMLSVRANAWGGFTAG